MICITCGQDKTGDFFYRCSTCRSGLRSECKQCLTKKNVARQTNNPRRIRQIQEWAKNNKDRRNASAQKYGQSTKGRARKMYHGMVWRVNHVPTYSSVEVRMAADEFVEWAIPAIEEFVRLNPDKTPSIDRINPDGHYEFGNMRILDVVENIIRSRYIMNTLGLTPSSQLQEKIQGVETAIQHLCDNLGIAKPSLTWRENDNGIVPHK